MQPFRAKKANLTRGDGEQYFFEKHFQRFQRLAADLRLRHRRESHAQVRPCAKPCVLSTKRRYQRASPVAVRRAFQAATAGHCEAPRRSAPVEGGVRFLALRTLLLKVKELS